MKLIIRYIGQYNNTLVHANQECECKNNGKIFFTLGYINVCSLGHRKTLCNYAINLWNR